jgi:DNA processing protein
MDYRRYILALREFGKVGPKRFQQLLLHFGSPDNVFFTSLEEISSLPRLSKEKAEVIHSAKDRLSEADQMIEYLETNQVQMTTILDESYPQLLKQISDPPPLLYHKGSFPVDGDLPTIAVVGETQPSQAAIARAVAMGKEIAAQSGIVVSGLARGIDAASHLGALAENGQTYAVLGSGFESIYPAENVGLAQNIADNGALISEYWPKVPVRLGQLLARNRIVVGLSQAVILVEEALESPGTADAANRVLEIGRPLFVDSNCPSAGYWQAKGGILLEGERNIEVVLRYL